MFSWELNLVPLKFLFNLQQKEMKCVYLLSVTTKLFERSWLWGNRTPGKFVKNMKKFFLFTSVLFVIILSPFIMLLKEWYQLSRVVFEAEQKLLTTLPVFSRDLNPNGLPVLKNTSLINWSGLKTENTIKYLVKSKLKVRKFKICMFQGGLVN